MICPEISEAKHKTTGLEIPAKGMQFLAIHFSTHFYLKVFFYRSLNSPLRTRCVKTYSPHVSNRKKNLLSLQVMKLYAVGRKSVSCSWPCTRLVGWCFINKTSLFHASIKKGLTKKQRSQFELHLTSFCMMQHPNQLFILFCRGQKEFIQWQVAPAASENNKLLFVNNSPNTSSLRKRKKSAGAGVDDFHKFWPIFNWWKLVSNWWICGNILPFTTSNWCIYCVDQLATGEIIVQLVLFMSNLQLATCNWQLVD